MDYQRNIVTKLMIKKFAWARRERGKNPRWLHESGMINTFDSVWWYMSLAHIPITYISRFGPLGLMDLSVSMDRFILNLLE